MKEQKPNRYELTSRQIDRIRKLYSEIGEPLAVDVLIDLYRHLDGAMELAKGEKPRPNPRRLQA